MPRGAGERLDLQPPRRAGLAAVLSGPRREGRRARGADSSPCPARWTMQPVPAASCGERAALKVAAGTGGAGDNSLASAARDPVLDMD